MEDDVIRAAGGIVTAHRGFRDKVLIVHRRRYDDWTLPKGKLNPGESAPAAALREVREETGIVARLQSYVGAVAYEVNGKSKVVQFWRMSVEAEHPLEPNEEVASRVWLPFKKAISRLTYPLERELLRTAYGRSSTARKKSTGLGATIGDWMRWTFLNGRARSRLEREHRLVEITCEELSRRAMARAGTADEPPWMKGTRDRLAAVRHHLDENDEQAG